jgi:hypothetical protein
MTLAAVAFERQRLPSWIEGFLELTRDIQSSERFRRWSAITVIGAALEQKVWVKTGTGVLYPNLYTILVGPPGSGKTIALSAAVKLHYSLKDQFRASTSLSTAALTDALVEARRKIVRLADNPPYVEFNSLFIPAPELGVLLPVYDRDFMNTLNTIYDCEPYSQRRRYKDINFVVENPQFNLLAATTPSYLNSFLPQGAWTEGFISRVILIYSGSAKPRPLWDQSQEDTRLQRDLINDLKIIGEKYGKLSFSREAADQINAWHLSGGEPFPEHPRLASYLERRTLHLLKLCIIATVARGNNQFQIETEDLDLARAWMEEAEEAMPDIFRAMQSSIGDGAVMEECWHFIWEIYAKEKKPVDSARLVWFLKERVPSHNLEKIIDVMVKAKVLLAHHTATTVSYSPAPKAAKG